ncbi:hypothetical protein MKEN_00952600 [Mycena kentingensis (nom. inval.)]|nr:hypothetical protein MKEN_00952600 [Mycena kentingensis (nom. inval.)]
MDDPQAMPREPQSARNLRPKASRCRAPLCLENKKKTMVLVLEHPRRRIHNRLKIDPFVVAVLLIIRLQYPLQDAHPPLRFRNQAATTDPAGYPQRPGGLRVPAVSCRFRWGYGAERAQVFHIAYELKSPSRRADRFYSKPFRTKFLPSQKVIRQRERSG